jgi:hypothetical protein
MGPADFGYSVPIESPTDKLSIAISAFLFTVMRAAVDSSSHNVALVILSNHY